MIVLNDLEKTSFKHVRHQTAPDGTVTIDTKKKSVSIITAGASKHHILHCIYEFNAARGPLRWTTGPKLYENFVDILQSHGDVTAWNVRKLALGNETVVNFETCLLEFIEYKFSGNQNAYHYYFDFDFRYNRNRNYDYNRNRDYDYNQNQNRNKTGASRWCVKGSLCVFCFPMFVLCFGNLRFKSR